MRTETIALSHSAPGTQQSLTVMRFGQANSGRKAYIQAALHADEVPAILVAHQLAERLTQLESRGSIHGEIVLVPFANPLGLAQTVLGQLQGRFDIADGANFNRGYADLASTVAQQLRPVLTQDAEQNAALVKTVLRQTATELIASTPAQDLKNQLLRLAVDADVVLDLHCDTDAVMHVYALTPQAEFAQQLGASVGAQAILLSTESGDSPFDEACSRTWLQLQLQLPEFPIPLGCFGATVELRGEGDTDHALAARDAEGLCKFLALHGFLELPAFELPPPLCAPTPLASSEPLVAPNAGVLVFHHVPGERVKAGDTIADVVDPLSGQVTPVRCTADGLMYARARSRWVTTGQRIAKVAGTQLQRTGKLLSP